LFLRRHRAALTLLAVFALYFATRLYHLKSLPMFCDEGIYIRWGQMAAHSGNFLVSLTDGKPPLHPLAMVPFIQMIKDPLVAGRVSTIVFGAFTTLGVFLLGRELHGNRLGVLSAFLYVICPFALWYDRLALAEGLLLTFFTWALFFAVKARTSGKLFYLIGTAVASGLALLTKSTALLLFPIIPFAYLVKRSPRGVPGRYRPLLLWLLAVAVSCLVAYSMFSLLRLAPGFHFIADLEKTRTLTFTELLGSPLLMLPGNTRAVFRVLFVYLTPAFLVMCFGGLLMGIVRRWRPAWFLLAWFGIAGLFESLVALFHFTRFFLILLPPLLIGAGYGVLTVAEWVLERRRLGSRGSCVAPGLAFIVLVSLIAVPAAVQVVRITSNPVKASLPQEDRDAFVAQWPAGYGTAEIAAYLEGESRKGPIKVVAIGAPGAGGASFPADAINAYLYGNANVEIVPVTIENMESCPQALQTAPSGTFCVINGIGESERVNDFETPTF